MKPLEFKRGDAFYLGCKATDANGVAVNLTGFTIRAHVRNAETDTLAAELTVEAVDLPNGEFDLWAPGDGLANWDAGCYVADIEYRETVGLRSIVRSTETMQIKLIQDVTR